MGLSIQMHQAAIFFSGSYYLSRNLLERRGEDCSLLAQASSYLIDFPSISEKK